MESLRTSLLAILLAATLEGESWPAVHPSAVIEMKVKTVAIDPNSQSPVVVLEGVTAKEYLPIWIDLPEARAISMEIEQVKPPRPLTHDLIRNLLNGLGASIKRVTITELRNNTYFATIAMSIKGQESEIDSRPSDAIAIALRMKAPIFVASKVLETSLPQSEPAPRADQADQRLGVRLQELTPELAKLMDSQLNRGLIVTDMVSGGVALKAGIQRGDIISKLNDQPVSTLAAFQSNDQSLSKSGRLNLEIIRKGKPMLVTIELP